MAKIGVEQSLTNVQQALREKGHDVVELRQESDVNGCDCCVTTGLDWKRDGNAKYNHTSPCHYGKRFVG